MCDFMHFGTTKWIVIACSTGIYVGTDKCSGPPISPGPGEIPPPPPPLSGPAWMWIFCSHAGRVIIVKVDHLAYRAVWLCVHL